MSLTEALPVCLTLRQKTRIEVQEKDEDRLPERMMEPTAGGSPFHKEAPMDAKDLD